MLVANTKDTAAAASALGVVVGYNSGSSKPVNIRARNIREEHNITLSSYNKARTNTKTLRHAAPRAGRTTPFRAASVGGLQQLSKPVDWLKKEERTID